MATFIGSGRYRVSYNAPVGCIWMHLDVFRCSLKFRKSMIGDENMQNFIFFKYFLFVRNVKFYTCCDEPYLDITFNITMRRKTLFYTVSWRWRRMIVMKNLIDVADRDILKLLC